MAALNDITIKVHLRPCIVWGLNALFHRWSDKSNALLHGGVNACTVGIVELEDGSICEALPADIRFLDHPHKNYIFNEREDEEE